MDVYSQCLLLIAQHEETKAQGSIGEEAVDELLAALDFLLPEGLLERSLDILDKHRAVALCKHTLACAVGEALGTISTREVSASTLAFALVDAYRGSGGESQVKAD